MSLSRLMVLVMTGFGVFVVVGLLLVAQAFMLPRYEEIESLLLETNMNRLEAMFENRLMSLKGVETSWAAWDEAYDFVQTKDEKFIESQLGVESLVTGGLNLMAYLDEAGEVITFRTADFETSEALVIPELRALLEKQNQSFQFVETTDSHSGLIWADGMMWLVAAGPVIKSNTEGPVRGSLVVAIALHDRELAAMKQAWQYDFTLQPFFEYKHAKGEQAVLLAGDLVRDVVSETEIRGSQLMEDYFGEKLVMVTLVSDREIYSRGVASLRNYTLIVGMMVVLGVILTMLSSHFSINKPLQVLMIQLEEIRKSRDFSKRLLPKGSIDFMRLGRSVNAVFEVNERLAGAAVESEKLLQERLVEMEKGFKELEQTKAAMMNILEDQRELEQQLKEEKEAVEVRVVARTQELTEEQAKLRGSIDSLPVGYLMVDKEGKPVMTNKAMVAIVGSDGIDQILSVVRSWLSGMEVPQKDQATGLPSTFIELSGVSHEYKYLNVSFVPIDTESMEMGKRGIGWVILASDVTEAKNLEKRRDEFFSIASHELRTPLTAIRGNTAMIRDYYKEALKDESLKEIVDDIHEGAVRLISIVNDFLDASRLELNKIEYALTSFDVVPLIKKVEAAIAPGIKEKGLDLVFDLGDLTSLTVLADEARTEQVLYNLLGNALKFTKKGTITIGLKNVAGQVEVWISDTGSGIPAENQQLLFKKFQQAGESVFTREASQGSGMGLYISKLLSRGMNGDIRLERSELGKGSTFVLSLRQG